MARTLITFDQHGNMHVEASGYTGNACAVMTDKLMAGLKTNKVKEEDKDERRMAGSVGGTATLAADRGWGR